MRVSKSTLVKGALLAAFAAGTLAASSATAASYVVCNRWGECWKVKEKYTTYPADVGVVWHDDAWYTAHEHDAHWRWLNNPDNDKGWYDKDGAWHPFADAAPPPP
jgi:hypothetical protein